LTMLATASTESGHDSIEFWRVFLAASASNPNLTDVGFRQGRGSWGNEGGPHLHHAAHLIANPCFFLPTMAPMTLYKGGAQSANDPLPASNIRCPTFLPRLTLHLPFCVPANGVQLWQ
jgi:hypothetical protein